MDQQQLHEHLDQLSRAIDGLQAPDDDKKLLVNLISSIEEQIAAPVFEDESQSLVDQVDTVVSTFETDHPNVAAILKNIMVTLTSMGV